MIYDKPKISVGFITFNDLTAKYLPDFLPSLKGQTYDNMVVYCQDHSDKKDNDNLKYVEELLPATQVEFQNSNPGFAVGFNRMIREAIKNGSKYFVALNPDMILEPELLTKLIEAAESDDKVGAVAAKILYWDFENKEKTDIIDSCGLSINRAHRFSEVFQAKLGNEISNEIGGVFGFTGAAALLRLEALRDVAFREDDREEYFDELMFMYKEDCDLSYRLRLAGWKTVLAPQAVCYHHRSVSPRGESNLKIAFNRRNKNKNTKRWSYLNHLILLCKLKNLKFSWRVKIATLWYQFKSLVFIILFEQFLLKELFKLWSLRTEIRKRREQLKVRVEMGEIEEFM